MCLSYVMEYLFVLFRVNAVIFYYILFTLVLFQQDSTSFSNI